MNDITHRPFLETDLDARIARLSPEKRALLLKRLSGGNKDPAYSPVLRATSDRQTCELSFAQQRLWFLDRLLPDKATYNIASGWRLRGRLDLRALQRSLDALVARHETLRTRFVMGESAPVQVIDPPHSVILPIDDLSAVDEVEREARAVDIANAHACRPFDLEAGPLLRAHLLRLAAEEHLLLLNVHHIVSDGWSAGIVERDLSGAYNAFVSGREPRLPELRIQYADYAVWQRGWLQGEVLEKQLGYWKKKLADLPTLDLPADRSRPPVMSYRGGRATFDLPAPLLHRLNDLSRREGATLFITVLAAFQVLLYRYSGQEDVAVGSPIAGRGCTEVEGLVGFFANTLVLRADLSGNPPFRELLARVRESALDAYVHQDLPFEKLVEELAPVRDRSRNPLFQVLFALQHAAGPALTLEGVRASRVVLARHTAKFDLSLSLRESPDALRARWEYSTDLFDGRTIERMHGNLQRLLEAIAADARQRIGDLSLLPAACVRLVGVPLTPSGRVDRRAVAAPASVSAHPPQTEPGDHVERTLCTLWAQTLGVEQVRLDDNFFDIGGHSLLAARLFARLDRALGRSLPLVTLFEAPTIRELARFYRGSAEPANRSALIPITSGGSLPPVFAVPGGFGNVLNYAELARALGTEQPFFGLQPVGLDGACEPLESIGEIAARYLHEIRQEQAHGPYRLLGVCFGSAVAYEIARQLIEENEEVAFLGMVDPSLIDTDVDRQFVMRMPASLKRRFALAKFLLRRCGLYWKEMRGRGFEGCLQFVRDKARLLGPAIRARDIFRGDRREFFQRRVDDTNLRAVYRHKHQPLGRRPGAVEIFVSEGRFDEMPEKTRVAWNTLSGMPVMFHRMPGKDSGDMIRGGNAKALATALSRRLACAAVRNRLCSEVQGEVPLFSEK